MAPNIIQIYARESTQTKKSYVTKQSFGVSSNLETPITDTCYVWEGKLHVDGKEINASNTRKDLGELAENLFLNIKNHPFSQSQRAEGREYQISYRKKRTEKQEDGLTIRTRPLKVSEANQFNYAFAEALPKSLVYSQKDFSAFEKSLIK